MITDDFQASIHDHYPDAEVLTSWTSLHGIDHAVIEHAAHRRIVHYDPNDGRFHASHGDESCDRCDALGVSILTPEAYEAKYGWPPDADGQRVIVWGAGRAHADAIREAAHDPAFAVGISDAERWLANGEGRWCVSLRPQDVPRADLDRDPAVVGYRCV